MNICFWNERWEKNEIAFHMKEVHPMMIKYFDKLHLSKGNRIFIPLCGKTLDISWLLSKGFYIVGIEINQEAVNMLFDELDVNPTISEFDTFTLYSAHNIEIFVGDFFNLTSEILGNVDAIYDRAALVALPIEMRLEYTSHLLNITNAASQLLISYEYEEKLKKGPPFSVKEMEIEHHYINYYEMTLLEENFDIPNGLKKKFNAKETIWLLKNS